MKTHGRKIKHNMMQLTITATLIVIAMVTANATAPGQPSATDNRSVEGSPLMTIPVDSPAFVFSPGNWTGDDGRGGKIYRQTWYPGAYFRFTWETTNQTSAVKLLLDIFTCTNKYSPPILAYNVDGFWNGNAPCTNDISITGIAKPGKHVLTVYFKTSPQQERWGVAGTSGLNVVRITGLQVDAGSKPVADVPESRWALIIGDSITEGSGATELDGYSHLVGQALQVMGYGYGISACGWSGWINKGDRPPGDVPGYYVIVNSTNGIGGDYLDSASRWNKIDANHLLLDARGRISAYGSINQEPSVIMINYGTNDSLHKSNPSDVQASITQCLAALRGAAPSAHIFFIIPFIQFKSKEIQTTVNAYRMAHPEDQRVSIIDLGPSVANARVNGYWGGLHPNAKGHATIAAKILGHMIPALCRSAPDKQD